MSVVSLWVWLCVRQYVCTHTALVPAIFQRASEAAANELVERSIHVSVVRLLPSVHAAGDHGFVPILINLARQAGVPACIGQSMNSWAAVHRMDVAVVFCLALKRGAKGVLYHVASEENVLFREIATEIG